MARTSYKLNGKALHLANAFGFLFPAEVFMIQAIAQSLPEHGVAVNIGAGVGTGTLALAEIRPDLKIYTVDISEGGPNGGLQNEVNAFELYKVTPLPTQILGDSQKKWEEWPAIRNGEPEIDYLFIDGDHSREGLKADMNWLQYVKADGFVLFHDYDSVHWPDVQKLVDKMVGNSDQWGLVHVVDTLIVFQRYEDAE